jgi:hypothetical protein
MKMNRNDYLIYNSPAIEIVEIVQEGVLCSSVTHEGFTGDDTELLD